MAINLIMWHVPKKYLKKGMIPSAHLWYGALDDDRMPPLSLTVRADLSCTTRPVVVPDPEISRDSR